MQNMLLRMWKEGRTLMRICSDCLLISNTRNIGDLHRKCYHSSMLSYNNMSCHAISCHTIICTVMSSHVMSCHVMSCHALPCDTSGYGSKWSSNSRNTTKAKQCYATMDTTAVVLNWIAVFGLTDRPTNQSSLYLWGVIPYRTVSCFTPQDSVALQ